jgi:hypothetical protein
VDATFRHAGSLAQGRVMSKLTALIGFLSLGPTIHTPALAERWQDIGRNQHSFARIDLDALKREGSLMTYTLDFTYPDDPRRIGRRDVSTAQIDCKTGLRRFLEITTIKADGTSTTTPGNKEWRPVRAYSTSERIRQLYCEGN